ncbi:MAG TPA: hypothetical protein VGM98_16815 [Schlesneria sp.]|jgi:hypothetical protein
MSDIIDDTGGVAYRVIASPGENASLPSCAGNAAIVSAQIFVANSRGDGPVGDAIGNAAIDGDRLIIPGEVTRDRSLEMLFMRVETDRGGVALKVIIDVH